MITRLSYSKLTINVSGTSEMQHFSAHGTILFVTTPTQLALELRPTMWQLLTPGIIITKQTSSSC